jgi:hypothetical protein
MPLLTAPRLASERDVTAGCDGYVFGYDAVTLAALEGIAAEERPDPGESR